MVNNYKQTFLYSYRICAKHIQYETKILSYTKANLLFKCKSTIYSTMHSGTDTMAQQSSCEFPSTDTAVKTSWTMLTSICQGFIVPCEKKKSVFTSSLSSGSRCITLQYSESWVCSGLLDVKLQLNIISSSHTPFEGMNKRVIFLNYSWQPAGMAWY